MSSTSNLRTSKYGYLRLSGPFFSFSLIITRIQLRISSVSGPKRYDYDPKTDSWLYKHDGVTLNDLLNTELSEALARRVDVRLNNVTDKVEK